jgi:SAM-dependent MidA family methyltransferase
MDAALYDPGAGFFARGGGAGRAGSDFITSPEVGGLFGTMVARWIDAWWDRLGRPDPYPVVEAGAGRGQLARAVRAASPRCAEALRYVLVERSAALRAVQHEGLPLEPADIVLGPAVAPEPDELPEPVPGQGPAFTSLSDLPATLFTGVVVANELLDNLPFRIVERSRDGWLEVRVGEGFSEVLVPAEEDLAAEVEALVGSLMVPAGVRLPVQTAMKGWLGEVGSVLRRGAVVVLDYAASVEDLVVRGQEGWLRTYRVQGRGGAPLAAPGSQDITADVCLEALHRAVIRAGFTVVEETTQAAWLRSLGVDELVDKARTAWHARTANDLEALKARSLVQEADALTDPSGLGAHRVLILGKGER